MDIVYTILRIDEPDYGCEGLPEGEELLDTVLVSGSDGTRRTLRLPDRLLLEQKLDEGSRFTLDASGLPRPFAL